MDNLGPVLLYIYLVPAGISLPLLLACLDFYRDCLSCWRYRASMYTHDPILSLFYLVPADTFLPLPPAYLDPRRGCLSC